MRHPRISIVTPSFNQAKYLRQTIESILKQGYPNLEYIIIDGGSTDGSVDIIKEYESGLSYWVSEPDSGQSDAINKGFGKSTGVLFNWINSDDILFPDALYQIAKTFTKHPEVDLVVGGHARSNDEGIIFRVSAAPSNVALSPANWRIPIGQQSTFISSKMFKKVGGVRNDLHYIMDTELYYRIYAAGASFVRTKAIIGMIREHAAAKGTANKDDWAPERESAFKEYGVSTIFHNLAKWKVRFCRLVDGSYFCSFVLSLKWNGKKLQKSKTEDDRK